MQDREVTIQTQPGKTEEAIRIYRDSVIPAAKQQKGFKSALLLTDPSTGKGISVTLWETEADQKACETSGYFQQQIAKFAAVFAGTPVLEAYVVSAQA